MKRLTTILFCLLLLAGCQKEKKDDMEEIDRFARQTSKRRVLEIGYKENCEYSISLLNDDGFPYEYVLTENGQAIDKLIITYDEEMKYGGFFDYYRDGYIYPIWSSDITEDYQVIRSIDFTEEIFFSMVESVEIIDNEDMSIDEFNKIADSVISSEENYNNLSIDRIIKEFECTIENNIAVIRHKTNNCLLVLSEDSKPKVIVRYSVNDDGTYSLSWYEPLEGGYEYELLNTYNKCAMVTYEYFTNDSQYNKKAILDDNHKTYLFRIIEPTIVEWLNNN